MTDHDGPSEDATQPIRLRKDDAPFATERIPTTSKTQRFERPPAPSTYYPPSGQYVPVQPYGPPRPMAPPPPAYNSVMLTGRPAASGAVVAIAWILALVTFLYLLPWAVAATRNKSNQGSIFVVNFFLGWSFIGWIIALVMACGSDPQTNVVVINNLPPQQQYYR